MIFPIAMSGVWHLFAKLGNFLSGRLGLTLQPYLATNYFLNKNNNNTNNNKTAPGRAIQNILLVFLADNISLLVFR
jgi:hypothetical protein